MTAESCNKLSIYVNVLILLPIVTLKVMLPVLLSEKVLISRG